MFTDRNMIKLPCQSILGRLIALVARKNSIKKHKLVGGFSFVNYWSNIQAEMLRQYLDYHSPETAPHAVLHCQRYSEPTSEEVVQEFLKLGVDFCIAFPLFPQYSVSSTLNSLRNLDKAIDAYDSHGKIKWSVIQSFNSHHSYLKLIADSVMTSLNEFPEDERNTVNIIFSAHSLPLSIIEQGDIYKSEIEKNLRKVKKILGLPNNIYLSWQSQEGKNWIEPKTIDVIKSISLMEGYGNANILVFPLSFVSDHIETLYDIDILQNNYAKECGVKCFKRCESFNDNPQFIEVLGNIFMDHIKMLNHDIKVTNEDELDHFLNFALVDNNIKKYIDGPIDSKKINNNHVSYNKSREIPQWNEKNKFIFILFFFFIVFSLFFVNYFITLY